MNFSKCFFFVFLKRTISLDFKFEFSAKKHAGSQILRSVAYGLTYFVKALGGKSIEKALAFIAF